MIEAIRKILKTGYPQTVGTILICDNCRKKIAGCNGDIEIIKKKKIELGELIIVSGKELCNKCAYQYSLFYHIKFDCEKNGIKFEEKWKEIWAIGLENFLLFRSIVKEEFYPEYGKEKKMLKSIRKQIRERNG